jgi:hypothetical protein
VAGAQPTGAPRPSGPPPSPYRAPNLPERRPTPGESSQDREHEVPNDELVSSNTEAAYVSLMPYVLPSPWITRRPARIILVDGRCCAALAGHTWKQVRATMTSALPR